MFVSRPESRLPSFSELVSSIQHQTYQGGVVYNAPYGYMPMPMAMAPVPMQSYFQPQGEFPSRSSTITPYARSEYDLVSSSPSLSVSESPLGSVRLLDLSRMTPENSVNSTMGSSASSVVSTPSSTPTSSVAIAEAPKRKHACTVCGRCFTTSGHLARHNRTHTGERKHVCPFPLCEARFARQDNCMQHYKTHINGKGRRNRNKAASPGFKPAPKVAETVWYTKP